MKVRDGWRLDGVLSVSRAIGDLPFRKSGLSAEPEITRLDLEEDMDTLVLTSDGLLHSLSMKTITDSFMKLRAQGCSYGSIAKQICQQAISNGVKDNITLIFVDLTKYYVPQQEETLEINNQSKIFSPVMENRKWNQAQTNNQELAFVVPTLPSSIKRTFGGKAKDLIQQKKEDQEMKVMSTKDTESNLSYQLSTKNEKLPFRPPEVALFQLENEG